MTPRFTAAVSAFSMALALCAANAASQPALNPDVVKACEADVKTLCPGIQPGEGRIAECLRKNRDKVSDGCKAQLKEMRGHGRRPRPASSPQ